MSDLAVAVIAIVLSQLGQTLFVAMELSGLRKELAALAKGERDHA